MELSDLGQALLNLNEKEILRIISTKLNNNIDPLSIVEELRIGIQAVGDQFGKGELFLVELIAAATFFDEAIKLVEPRLTKVSEDRCIGKIVIGTVAGDVHDLGKNIVITMLKINGFEIQDLGVDVPTKTFVEKVKEFTPDIVGISCLLTTSLDPMKKTISELRKAQNNPRCKIMIGGGIVTEMVREYVGADYYGKDVVEALRIAKSIVDHI